MIRSLVEGLKYFIRTFWISSIAITVLTLSIGLIALSFNAKQILNTALKQLDKKATIQVLIQDTATELDLKNIEKNLTNVPSVSTVEFVSKEEQKKTLSTSEQNTADYSGLFDDLGFNPFLNSFVITPSSTSEYKSIVTAIENINFTKTNQVQKVVAKQNLIDSFTTWTNRINIFGWVFVIIFGLISFIVIVNILRISISYFQNEIEIQRLVGATNHYIQGPFIVQGFLFAAIASTFVFAATALASYLVLPKIGQWFGILDTTQLNNEIFLTLSIVLAVSIIIATAAALYSTTRYLKK